MKTQFPQDIIDIMAAGLLGTITPAEQECLDRWMADNPGGKAFYARLSEPGHMRRSLAELYSYDPRRDWKNVQRKRLAHRNTVAATLNAERVSGHHAQGRPSPRRSVRRLMPYAAALLVVLLAGGIYLMNRGEQHYPGSVEMARALHPGGTKAVLTTGDGQVFELDGQEHPATVEFSHDGGVLSYMQRSEELPAHIHTVRTPRGGEYQIVLSDGSRVWLNAMSELSYPAAFGEGERVVELSGEAYFIVAADREHPFVVRTGDRTTTAIGTSFNVRTYETDYYQATLLSGKVEVTADGGHVELVSGQQAVVAGDGISVRAVNTADYIGWRENRFVYRGRPLRQVMADMERWYDIEVSFADPAVAAIALTGSLPKYDDFGAVMEIIEQAAFVKVEVRGKKVSIRKR
ncbi:FecR domain-containing protein [Alistipes sp. OttesenSCG-928-B03]|nr:FecR domain-containing protein [Alistipes sp. OttesenSCG-928-B03]